MRGDGWVLREGRGRIRALWRARRTDLLVAGRGGLEVGGYQAITSTSIRCWRYISRYSERIELIGAACNGKYIAGNEKY